MKIDAIVYESNTGFTRKYAELLSQATDLPAYERKMAGTNVKKDSAVFYMGWLLAGSVKGFKKARSKFRIKGLAAVGMSNPADEAALDAVLKYRQDDMPAFYLQGGFDKNKLRGIYKFMMNNVSSSLSKKENKTDAELQMLDITANGADFIKKENLDPIIAWIAL
jgi:predicted NodU family carbamoyl transferase